MKFDILVILFYIFFCGMGAWLGATIGLALASVICFTLDITTSTIFIVWSCILLLGLLGLFLGLGPAYAVHLLYQFLFDHLLPTIFTVDLRKPQQQDLSTPKTRSTVH